MTERTLKKRAEKDKLLENLHLALEELWADLRSDDLEICCAARERLNNVHKFMKARGCFDSLPGQKKKRKT